VSGTGHNRPDREPPPPLAIGDSCATFHGATIEVRSDDPKTAEKASALVGGALRKEVGKPVSLNGLLRRHLQDVGQAVVDDLLVRFGLVKKGDLRRYRVLVDVRLVEVVE
jgi:hypothetical protein